ncbi:MAG: NUDIX domain-containing protein [Patescibacteria group bacterium]
MRNKLIKEIKEMAKTQPISKRTVTTFIERLNSTDPITRDENLKDHYCAFYVPIDRKTKQLYLIVHKKSGLWMPPGGHIDKGEDPVTAVKRECNEELNFEITNEPVELFTISVDPIDNPIQPCKIHYSLWYMVKMDKMEFEYNEKESTDGKWVGLKEAQKLVTFKTFLEPIASLSSYLEL